MSKAKQILESLMDNDSFGVVNTIKESLSESARASLLETQMIVAEQYGMKKKVAESDEDDEEEDEDKE